MADPLPDFNAGVAYWSGTTSNVNGVLGGYGETTPVPLLDALSSRLTLLTHLPYLSTIPSPSSSSSSSKSSNSNNNNRRLTRALDAGAGIGRITSSVLLPLFDRVELVEPVSQFLATAESSGKAASTGGWALLAESKGKERKGVRTWKAGLQFADPARLGVPLRSESNPQDEPYCSLSATMGAPEGWVDPATKAADEDGYDAVWIQWCIGHLSDVDFVAFLKRSKAALRRVDGKTEGFVFLKENICSDDVNDGKGALWDEDDSSYTRSDKVFRRCFKEAGLEIKSAEEQKGFPDELFPVYTYALQ